MKYYLLSSKLWSDYFCRQYKYFQLSYKSFLAYFSAKAYEIFLNLKQRNTWTILGFLKITTPSVIVLIISWLHNLYGNFASLFYRIWDFPHHFFHISLSYLVFYLLLFPLQIFKMNYGWVKKSAEENLF